MKCDRAAQRLDAFADGEVRGWRRLALRRHLAGCPGCAARLEETRAMRRRIRAELPRFTAPAGLRAKAESLRDRDQGVRSTPRPLPWRWALGGAVAGAALTMVGALTFNALLGARAASDTALARVDEHARAVVAQRAVVVASSDQHTVKPWLSSHLDYSPPVHDFGDAGFALLGARIVRIQSRTVAVLVYRHRLHMVDVYVEPAGEQRLLAATETIRGFNLLPLTAHGMDWTIVSDASVDALGALARSIREAGP